MMIQFRDHFTFKFNDTKWNATKNTRKKSQDYLKIILLL